MARVYNLGRLMNSTQIEELEELVGQIDGIVNRRVVFNADLPFIPQARSLMDQLDIRPGDIIIPPPLPPLAAMVVVGYYDRVGEFPDIVRYRPENRGMHVAEVIALREMRGGSRR